MQNSKKGEGNKAEKSGQIIHIEQEQLEEISLGSNSSRRGMIAGVWPPSNRSLFYPFL